MPPLPHFSRTKLPSAPHLHPRWLFRLLEVAAASFIRTSGAVLSFSIQRGRQQGAPTARAARSQSCSHPCSPRSQQQVPGGAGGFAFASFSGDSDFGSSKGRLEGSRRLFRCCCAFLFTSPLLLGSALLLLRSRKVSWSPFHGRCCPWKGVEEGEEVEVATVYLTRSVFQT